MTIHISPNASNDIHNCANEHDNDDSNSDK